MTDSFYDPLAGDGRELVDVDEAGRWQARGVLQQDTRRRRPLWFDGRFLAARDLTREQQYVLARQSDLGRMMGFGVTTGLVVQTDGNRVTVTPGHGITPSGELIALLTPATFSLDDLPAIERINATFGLAGQPTRVDRNRTGLFVLAARPVEYTARPTARYPTSLTGDRGIEDGEIIEAVAFSLIPFDDDPADKGGDRRRARAAHDIFVRGVTGRVSPEVLPLAMLALDRGVLQWVDHYLVRREAGVEDVLGFGLGHRAVREAHLRQYDAHLRALVAEAGEQVAAIDHFVSLPPAGLLPRGAVRLGEYGLDQRFFPPQMDVRISLLPVDELPALLEDSLALPPIDLTLPDAALEATPVLVLVPVDRARLAPIARELNGDTGERTPMDKLRLDAPLRLIRRQPYAELKMLRRLRVAAVEAVAVEIDPERARQERWAALAADAPWLWYVRRRTPADVAPIIGFERYGTPPPIDDLPPDWPQGEVDEGPSDGGNGNGEVRPQYVYDIYRNMGEEPLYNRLLRAYDYTVSDSLAFTMAPQSMAESEFVAIAQLYDWALRAIEKERLDSEILKPDEPLPDAVDVEDQLYRALDDLPDGNLGFEGGHGDLSRSYWVNYDVLEVLRRARPSRAAARVIAGAGRGFAFLDEINWRSPEDRLVYATDMLVAAENRGIEYLFERIPTGQSVMLSGWQDWVVINFERDERRGLAQALIGDDRERAAAFDEALRALGSKGRALDGAMADVLLGALGYTVAGALDKPPETVEQLTERVARARRTLEPRALTRIAAALAEAPVRKGLTPVLDGLGEKVMPRLVLGWSGVAGRLGALVSSTEAARQSRLVKQIVQYAGAGDVAKLRGLIGGLR